FSAALRICELPMKSAYIGPARKTRKAKMASAIISSIRVKPLVRMFMFRLAAGAVFPDRPASRARRPARRSIAMFGVGLIDRIYECSVHSLSRVAGRGHCVVRCVGRIASKRKRAGAAKVAELLRRLGAAADISPIIQKPLFQLCARVRQALSRLDDLAALDVVAVVRQRDRGE